MARVQTPIGGGLALRAARVVDLLAVRSGGHDVGIGGSHASARRPGLAWAAFASAPQSRWPNRLREVPCRIARFAHFSLP